MSVPAGTGTVTQITAGYRHTCAIKTDATPTCWGNDGNGQASVPAGTGTVTQITAGGYHTCAIKTDGTPTCWGFNSDGQASVPAGTGTVTQITAGTFHSCAIKTDGTPTCWGEDVYGQASVPAGTGTVTQITAGYYHTCAIKTDGTPTCWGNDLYGQTSVPAGTGTVTQITAGDYHTCAIKTDGTPTCWGLNGSGQLGRAPAFTASALNAVIGASPAALSVAFSAAPAATVDVASGTLAPGLTLNALTGAITGTATTQGTYSGTFTASNGIFADATQPFTILVDLTSPATTDNVPAAFVNAPFAVTLSPTDAGGSLLAHTYYTTGTTPATPTTSSAVYDPASKPVLQEGERISYFSTDGAGNSEAVQTSAPLKLDATDPATSDDVPTAYVNAPFAVTLSPTDSGGSGLAQTYYTTGTTPATPTTSSAMYDPATKPVLSGDERISYFSTDGAGNSEAIQTSTPLKLDATDPATSDDVPTAYVNAPFAVTLSPTDSGGSGLAQTYYTTGTTPATPTTSSAMYDPATKPVLSGDERISYFSTDGAGNSEAIQTSTPLKLDATVPATSDDVPAASVDAPFAVTLTPTDSGGSGVAHTYYTTGTTPTTPTASSAVYDPASKPVLHDGERISYFSTDNAANAEAVKTSSALHINAPATAPPPPGPPPPVAPPPPAPPPAGPVLCQGKPATIIATATQHHITGTARADVIIATDRADTIDGRAGNDTICAGAGNDTIHGAAGNDTIRAGAGNDSVLGDSGNDLLLGGAGNDDLHAGRGNDRLGGGDGDDRADGGPGDDLLDEMRLSGRGNDHLLGDTGNDHIRTAGDTKDTVDCGPGRDFALLDTRDKHRRCDSMRRVASLPR